MSSRDLEKALNELNAYKLAELEVDRQLRMMHLSWMVKNDKVLSYKDFLEMKLEDFEKGEIHDGKPE